MSKAKYKQLETAHSVWKDRFSDNNTSVVTGNWGTITNSLGVSFTYNAANRYATYNSGTLGTTKETFIKFTQEHDYGIVEANVTFISANVTAELVLIDSAVYGYRISIVPGTTNNIKIIRYDNGTAITLNTYSATINQNQTYAFKGIFYNQLVSLYIDGVYKFLTVNVGNTYDYGSMGFRFSSTANNQTARLSYFNFSKIG